MSQKAVIFDMDGVICHTNPVHSQAFKIFFEKRALYPSEKEFVEHMYGKSNSYILSHFLGRPITGEEFIAMENEKEGLFRELYKDQVTPLSGFESLLSQLKQEKFKTGVATSAPKANLDLIMGTLGFEKNMESVMASENVSQHKPHPEIYLTTAKNLHTDIHHCLVFEDSHSGVTAARNAGMKVVGVLTSHSKKELPECDYYIRDFTQIKIEIIEEILNR